MTEITKKCTGACARELPLEAFSKQRTGRHGRTSQCKECKAASAQTLRDSRMAADAAGTRKRDAVRMKAWRDENRDKLAAQWKERRRKVTLASYGLTQADYDRLLVAQGGQCPICKSTDPQHWSGQFQVDHDHYDGSVRGLLCAKCNGGLGLLGDTVETLTAAVTYLSNARSRTAGEVVPIRGSAQPKK